MQRAPDARIVGWRLGWSVFLCSSCVRYYPGKDIGHEPKPSETVSCSVFMRSSPSSRSARPCLEFRSKSLFFNLSVKNQRGIVVHEHNRGESIVEHSPWGGDGREDGKPFCFPRLHSHSFRCTCSRSRMLLLARLPAAPAASPATRT